MKLTIPQPILARLLQTGAAVAPKNSAVPIMNHCRLAAADDRLTISSTDGDRFDSATESAAVEMAGETTINASAFIALISRYPSNKDVSLALDGTTLHVQCGRSRVKLAALPADDFPTWAEWPGKAEFVMPAEDFIGLFNRTQGACAPAGPLKPFFQGVYFHVADGKLRAMATDTHRFARMDVALPEGAADMPGVIVPTEAISAAFRVLKGVSEIAVKVTESTISFSGGDAMLASKLIEGPYPDTSALLSRPIIGSMAVSRAEVSACLDRAALTTEEGTFSHISIVPGEKAFIMRARNSKGGEHIEEFEVDGGEDIRPFGFSPGVFGFVLGLLEGETATIQQVDPKGAHYIFDEEDPAFFGAFSAVMVGAV